MPPSTPPPKTWPGWSAYSGNLKWLPGRTILLTNYGSHAYGTNQAGSDLDVRGVAVAPSEYYFGYDQTFEQATQNEPLDLVVFELRKFFRLAAYANSNALELLFTDESDHLQVTPAGRLLLENRDLFLSRQIKDTFSGYATQQLRRLQGHYRWLKNPPKAPPTRSELGLPEKTLIPADQLAAARSMITKKMDEWSWQDLNTLDRPQRLAVKEDFHRKLLEITQWDNIEDNLFNSAVRTLGFSDNFIHLLQQEKLYKTRMDEWNNYQKWLKERNPARAALEAEHGYDCKHAMHLVRLYRMCVEALRGEGLKVRRPDADELLAIRQGAWTYEYLIEWVAQQDATLPDLMKASPLPVQPDFKKLRNLCYRIAREAV